MKCAAWMALAAYNLSVRVCRRLREQRGTGVTARLIAPSSSHHVMLLLIGSEAFS